MASRRSASPERPSETLEGDVRELARGGDGVVLTPRGAVFVAGVFPGDSVRLRSVERSRGAQRAELDALLVPSPDRVVAACAHATACGGCPWMALSESAQHRAKHVFVESAVKPCSVEFAPTGPILGYRRRARLVWGRGRLGYRGARSRSLVAIESCAVLDPRLEAARRALGERLVPVLAGEGELRLALGAGGRSVASLETATAQPRGVYDRCESLLDVLAGLTLRVEGATGTWGDPREVAIALDGAPLVGPPSGFSQANEVVNRALVQAVARLSETSGMRVLELYAGHGNLTCALAPGASGYTAVEQDAPACEALRQNLAARGLTAHVVCGDAAAHAKGPKVDVVVLDPPRAGAAATLDALAARKPARLVYVSCDTATLARDLQRLAAHGYVVDHALAFDMFPHTAHVEAVVRLIRP